MPLDQLSGRVLPPPSEDSDTELSRMRQDAMLQYIQSQPGMAAYMGQMQDARDAERENMARGLTMPSELQSAMEDWHRADVLAAERNPYAGVPMPPGSQMQSMQREPQPDMVALTQPTLPKSPIGAKQALAQKGRDGMKFGAAFAEARKAGEKEFTWRGNRFTTEIKAEKAKRVQQTFRQKSLIRNTDTGMDEKLQWHDTVQTPSSTIEGRLGQYNDTAPIRWEVQLLNELSKRGAGGPEVDSGIFRFPSGPVAQHDKGMEIDSDVFMAIQNLIASMKKRPTPSNQNKM